MNILMLNSTDLYGGAARIAWDLFSGYRERGHHVDFYVGHKLSDDPDVHMLNPRSDRSPIDCTIDGLKGIARKHPGMGMGKLARVLRNLNHRNQLSRKLAALPNAASILATLNREPDIIHIHNLHGDYFDWSSLPALSSVAPIVITMHDNWLLTGGCAYHRECAGWTQTCGICPTEMLSQVASRPGTIEELRLKAETAAQCRLYLSAPSAWALNKYSCSVIQSVVREAKVIHNGRNLNQFSPGDRQVARAQLGLDPQAFIVLYMGAHFKHSPWKDWTTIYRAIKEMPGAANAGNPIHLVGLGEAASTEVVGSNTIMTVPFTSDVSRIVDYFRAANVYAHTALADTFPNVVIEALACGLPVIGVDQGGIPEQIEICPLNNSSPDLAVGVHIAGTGFLVPPRDPVAMRNMLIFLQDRPHLATQLGENAASAARLRFAVERMVSDYLNWFNTILQREASKFDSGQVLSCNGK